MTHPARRQVVKALARQLRSAPGLGVGSVDTAGLDARDARLAVAIHRTVLQRYLTLSYLLDRHLRKPLYKLEPAMSAVLLSGAAQLIFMSKLPPHAVVDESVKLARQILRAGAGKLANAVLRKLADQVSERREHEPWRPAADRLPDPPGVIVLASPVLPSPDEDRDAYLAVVTSHPVELVQHWRQLEPDDDALIALLLHSLVNAPTIVNAGDTPAPPADVAAPHEQPGFYVWRGPHAALVDYLAADGRRLVQDPTSAAPVAATAHLAPRLIIDLCAGRGTKSRQLAAMHPEATIIAADPDADRFGDLQQVASQLRNVRAVEPAALEEYAGRADLVIADVPCSNTGVLARRLEARYRFHETSLHSLVELQREIAERAASLLSPTGRLLYATCSIEPRENEQQATWIESQLGMHGEAGALTRPGGHETTYHDGGYFRLFTRSPV